MADPVSVMAATGMAATIAGGGIKAYGQDQAGIAQQKMYNYRAQVAEQNRIYEIGAGERRATELGLQQRYRMGNITAAQGASGLDLMRGTAVDVRAGQKAADLTSQEDVRYAAARRAYGEQVEEQLDTASGKYARYEGEVGAAGTILGTVGSVADKWYQGKSVGIT